MTIDRTAVREEQPSRYLIAFLRTRRSPCTSLEILGYRLELEDAYAL